MNPNNNKNNSASGTHTLPVTGRQSTPSDNTAPINTPVSADSRQSPITLPTGGGAIRSIGEKFEANPATGTASFTVPLTISEGRDGFTPQLALSYDSGSGNSAFGLGWSIGLPNITRKTDKGLPQYGDNPNNETDTFILSGAEDLVPVWENDERVERIETIDYKTYKVYPYQPRTEGLFALIERWVDITPHTSNPTPHTSHWRTISKENITSVYGVSETARIANPAKPYCIFSWLIEESWDAKGNLIRFTYKKEDGIGVESSCFESHRLRLNNTFANTYLKYVSYGNKDMCIPSATQSDYTGDFLFNLVFDYGDHQPANTQLFPNQNWEARPDAFSNYKAGFDIRTYRLCKRVLMFHQFIELGIPPILVRSTDLEYKTTPSFSLLETITHYGYEGTNKETFPPLEFSYTKAQPGTSFKTVPESMLKQLPAGIDGENYQWTDLYSEGISGILNMTDNAWYFKPNYGAYSPPSKKEGCPKGGVVFGNMRSEIPKPADVKGKGTTYRLGDVDSDGFPELIIEGNGLNGFYSKDETGKWLNFRQFSQYPNVNTGDANLRFMDLSGDGLADMVISKGEYFDIYLSEGKKGFGSFRRVRCGNSAGFAPQVLFSDSLKRIFLADMSGDGLTDIVKITHSSVVYWPNLGYGKFGEKIIMSNPPLLDSLDQFDTRFVHLADVDGTGTTDLLYISKGKIRYYKNLSGNAWAEEPLSSALSCTVTQQHFVQLTDLLGNGTQCVVVTSSLPTQAKKMRYWELTSGIKPFLLSEINNNMGGITKLHYCSSTKFYIQDKLSGKPWITKLPFPVHVLEKVETIDLVGNKHFTNCYAYHHGYFDPVEREFRGFGMVEQWDTETYNSPPLAGAGGGNIINDELNVSPGYTKTWFHTGFYKNRSKISKLFADEYFKDEKYLKNNELDTWQLPDTVLPKDLSGEEAREACRALRGSILRTEVYAQDGTDKEAFPYTVEEKSYFLQCLQDKGKNKHAVFLKTDAESLLFHYERNVEDPRILHKLVLETDKYGNQTKTAEIAYPRKISTLVEQGRILSTFTENNYINEPNNNTRLIGILYQTKQYEIHNLSYTGNKFEIAALLSQITQSQEIDYATVPTVLNVLLKRIFQHTRTFFWDETCETPLILGQIAPHALRYQQQSLELTPGLIDLFNNTDEKLTETLLTDTCKYMYDEGSGWFAVSDVQDFDPEKFYLPVAATDPFDNVTTIEYDEYNLFPIKVTDALEFETIAEYDYRILQASKLTDPNGNNKEVAFDTLGMVTALAISGKNGEGDTLNDPTEEYNYSLHCWKEFQKPVYAYTAKRETHSDPNTRCIETYIYTDGLGNEIMTKTTAEDGKAFILFMGAKTETETDNRWLASGKVIYNNKGLPVKQYEPWYSNTHDFTFEEELTHYGVTPILHYDPLGRLIQTDFPDGTKTLVAFDPWQQLNYDQNDCDENSQHYNTPQIIDFDALGRPFMTNDNLGNDIFVVTKKQLDITGRIVKVTDALGKTATVNTYALSEKHLLLIDNIDSGKRWLLNDTSGKPIKKWDEREHEFTFNYDELQRPTDTTVNNACVECIIYGIDEQENNIGQVIEIYAQDGKTTFEYDFKGNIILSRKQFTQDYNMVTNWDEQVDLQSEQFITQTAFDALNRPIAIIHPDNSDVSYEYDKGGLLQKVLKDQVEHVTNITYNAKGQRKNIYYGNNTKTRYYYDSLNFRLTRLLTTRNMGQDILQDLNYEYDAVGNIVEITDDAQQIHYFNNQVIAPVATFEYDALYRLIQATGRELTALTAPTENDFANNLSCPNNASNAMQNYVHNYQYDVLGNILEDAWKSYQYNTINNFLLGNNNIANQYEYDNHGNITSMSHLSLMSYDYNDRLISASNGTFTSYYNYDIEGNRTRKVVVKSNIREERYYIGGYEVYREYNANVLDFERSTVNISDDEKVFARIESAGQSEIIRYQYDNHLGSACLELDENGYIISYEEYHPFGTTSYRAGRNQTEVSQKRYKYCGKERDEETGLYYFGARYYAAWLCRFISCDSKQFDYPQVNPYCYVLNNPVNLIDPDGRAVIAPDRTTQKYVKSYLKEHFGTSNMFKFNSSGELQIKEAKFNKALENATDTQATLLRGLESAITNENKALVKIEAKANNDEMTFDVGSIATGTDRDGFPSQDFLTTTIEGVKENFGGGFTAHSPTYGGYLVGVSHQDAQDTSVSAGFQLRLIGKDDWVTTTATTGDSASSVFFHELLDEFLNFHALGTVTPDSPQEDKVQYQNAALQNINKRARDGADHQKN